MRAKEHTFYAGSRRTRDDRRVRGTYAREELFYHHLSYLSLLQKQLIAHLHSKHHSCWHVKCDGHCAEGRLFSAVPNLGLLAGLNCPCATTQTLLHCELELVIATLIDILAAVKVVGRVFSHQFIGLRADWSLERNIPE